jgi:tripartite ATP-independent transporter DctP family solute receptor
LKKFKGFGLDNTPRGTAVKAFTEFVEKESTGEIEIEFCPIETYGTEHEMIEAIQTNALEMQVVGANMMAKTIPQFASLSLPFLIQSIDEGHAVLDGPVGDYLKKLAEAHGFKVLADVALGYAQTTNNVRPINTPDDLTGLKIRAPNDVCFVETFKEFGASVTTMTYTEIYTGLSQGVIDGQFNPLANTFDLNINEVQDFLAMTNHAFYVAFIIMNKKVFDDLDPGLQQILLEGGNNGRDAARKSVGENEIKLQERSKTAFKEITYPEMKPFQEAVQPIYAKMEEIMGSKMIKCIQDFLKQYRSENSNR